MKVALVVLLLVVAMAAAWPGEEPQKLCGRELSEALTEYCAGIENSKNSDSVIYPQRYWSKSTNEKVVNWLLRRSEKLQIPAPAQNIVEECCKKPCYLTQLLNFCTAL